MGDSWSGGNSYELFMGRWSAPIARQFLGWLGIPAHSTWLDVGCGTGSLTKILLDVHQPEEIIAIDSSSEFISYARKFIKSDRVHFDVGLAQSLDLKTNSIDAVVSGLVLNFVPAPEIAMSEFMRVTRPGGSIGVFLWDYADGMQMLRYFWDAAITLNPQAKEFDEGVRFPLCQEGKLKELFEKSGLKEIEATSIETQTEFENFEDFWQPFLSEVGPAPAYVAGLSPEEKNSLKELLRESLRFNPNGSLSLKARAWAVKAIA